MQREVIVNTVGILLRAGVSMWFYGREMHCKNDANGKPVYKVFDGKGTFYEGPFLDEAYTTFRVHGGVAESV